MVASATRPLVKPRRTLYIGLSLLCILIVFSGFWPSYFESAIVGAVDHPTIIHIHAVIYVGWLMLFLAQTWFAATGQIALHKKIGNWAIYYGVLVILAGWMVTFGIFYIRVQADLLAQTQTAFFSVGPPLDMIVFMPFFAAAVYFRKVPELHKRLMIVATTALLIAAVARMWFWGTPRPYFLEYLVWTSPILIAMVHDFVKRRIVHPVYVAGLIVIALESSAVRRVINGTDTWLAFNGWLTNLFSG